MYRYLELLRNGKFERFFNNVKELQLYVNNEREKDLHVKFWALEYGDLVYDFKRQVDIDEVNNLKKQVMEMQETMIRFGIEP